MRCKSGRCRGGRGRQRNANETEEADICTLGADVTARRAPPEQLRGSQPTLVVPLPSTLQGLLRCFPDHPSCCVS